MAHSGQKPAQRPAAFAAYRPLPGVPDAMVDQAGALRPEWRGLIAHLDAADPAGFARDVARGNQYLRDAGVFFRKYSDTGVGGRDWPYSPIPVILPQAEWAQIAAGLMQRADLLEMVAADLYGANRLVADGHLPAALVAQNPGWLRPLVGVVPRSGHFLHFVAFEIGRGPDGRWWVLGDRTEAPSGAGFALENRVATTRVFPELYRASNVHRLAGFFRAFRDALQGLRADPGGQAAILSPGPLTETYYEQAYIARYLGLLLLEGGDLTVENGALMVRTVSGLAPVDVVWRRMDANWSDPLDLDETSMLGTPGLVSALRQGSACMVNALGVGVLETQALMAFLPGICLGLTGKPLALPNIATWWCGGAGELAHVRAHADRMMIGPALATRLPFDSDAPYALAGVLRGETSLGLDAWLARDAANLVGQELVTLSTTPVFDGTALVPRPMSLRVFLARTPQGWQVMPGGFARIGASPDTTAISMRNGGTVADVWVVSDTAVDEVTMLAAPHAPFVRAAAGPLPSRAADNLFWLGRYTERTEGLLRLIRACNGREAEAATAPLIRAIRDLLAKYKVDPTDALPTGLRATMASAVQAASQIRDRFSPDGWAALQDMEKSMGRMVKTAQPGADAALVMSVLLRKIAGFSGLVHENMYRAAGWRFLTIGRSLERAAMLAEVLAVFADPASPDGGLDLAIEIGDSAMTHRQRYAVTTSRQTVIDLLALDAQNPRSVLFHVAEINAQIGQMQPAASQGQMTGLARHVLALQSGLMLHTTESLDTAALLALRTDLLALSRVLGETCLL